jgi:hypothetical protein
MTEPTIESNGENGAIVVETSYGTQIRYEPACVAENGGQKEVVEAVISSDGVETRIRLSKNDATEIADALQSLDL